MYDVDNSGLIDKDEMINVIRAVYNMLEATGCKVDDNPKVCFYPSSLFFFLPGISFNTKISCS